MNLRRKLLVAAGGGALCAPLGALAQQASKPARIGWLVSSSAAPNAVYQRSFVGRMRELGRLEGRDYSLEFRYAEGDNTKLPGLAAELARLKVDIILTTSTTGGRAAQKAADRIPIVMVSSGDPVGGGLIKSMARPGGNITGNTNNLADLAPKHLDLLIEAVPRLSRLGLLMRAAPSHLESLNSLQAPASARKIAIHSIVVANMQEIEAGFSRMAQEKVQAVIVIADPLFTQNARQVAGLAAKGQLPTITLLREYVLAGLLMSYGPSESYLGANAAVYVDKILKGANPADLPVEQATKLDFVFNLKTAKALGIAIAPLLRMRADDVIE